MGFSKEVSNAALVSCGRCCCICHKFCGTKIELHHIKQVANDGKNVLDNCIPLCFECHADMGKADPQHPKGKHYTEAELRAHRDNWYKKVQDSPSSFSGEGVYDADKKLFEEICKFFNDDVQSGLKDMDIGGHHPSRLFFPLSELRQNRDKPFFEFINIKLETLKCNLMSVINDFLNFKAINTFPKILLGEHVFVTRQWLLNHDDWIPHNPDKLSIDEINRKYEEEAQTLNTLATIVWENYCEFVRQGRRVLSQ